MATSYYGTSIYGVDSYGGGIGIDTPDLLTYHINEIDGMYTFYWTFNQLFINDNLANVHAELDISDDISFPPASTITYVDSIGTRIRPNSTEDAAYYAIASYTDTELTLTEPYAGTTKTQHFYKTRYPSNPVDAVLSAFTATFTNGSNVVTGTGFNAEALIVADLTKTDALYYHDGGPIRGYDIRVIDRIYDATQTVYARIRNVIGVSYSQYSLPLTVTISEDYSEKYAESLTELLPDAHVYNKDVLRLPLAERVTNLFNVMRMYGHEFDFLKIETAKLAYDISIEVGRDEMLYDNFGSYFDYARPGWMDYTQYRLTLKAMYESIFYSGTDYAIQRIVAAFTGVYPSILNIRDIADFYVYSDTTYIYDSTLKWIKYYDAYTTSTPAIAISLYSAEPQGPLPHVPTDPSIGQAWVVNNWGGSYVDNDVYEWNGAQWIKISTLTTGQRYVIASDAVGTYFAPNRNNIVTWDGSDWSTSAYAIPSDGDVVLIRRQNNQAAIAKGKYVHTNSRQFVGADWIPYDGVLSPMKHVVSIMLTGDEAYAGTPPVGTMIGECRISNMWGDAYPDNGIYEWDGSEWIYQGILETGDAFVLASAVSGSLINPKYIAVKSDTGWDYTAPVSDVSIVTMIGKLNKSVLQATSPAVFDRNSMAFGIRIHVNNPGNFTLDMALIRYLLAKIIPVHIYYEVT